MENPQNLWRFIRGDDVVTFLNGVGKDIENIKRIFFKDIDPSVFSRFGITITQMRSAESGVFIDINIYDKAHPDVSIFNGLHVTVHNRPDDITTLVSEDLTSQ